MRLVWAAARQGGGGRGSRGSGSDEEEDAEPVRGGGCEHAEVPDNVVDGRLGAEHKEDDASEVECACERSECEISVVMLFRGDADGTRRRRGRAARPAAWKDASQETYLLRSRHEA